MTGLSLLQHAYLIPLLPLAAFVVIAFLQYFAVCVRDGLYANLWAANLVIWGAFSNLYDRLYRGYVVDYIHIGPLPVMNISDIAIVAGLIVHVYMGATLEPRPGVMMTVKKR